MAYAYDFLLPSHMSWYFVEAFTEYPQVFYYIPHIMWCRWQKSFL